MDGIRNIKLIGSSPQNFPREELSLFYSKLKSFGDSRGRRKKGVGRTFLPRTDSSPGPWHWSPAQDQVLAAVPGWRCRGSQPSSLQRFWAHGLLVLFVPHIWLVAEITITAITFAHTDLSVLD